MRNEKNANVAIEARTSDPHIPGTLTPTQRANLAQLTKWAPSYFVWDPTRGEGTERSKGRTPINPKTGRFGKTNDPTTAGTFDQAANAIPPNGGIGVLITDAKPGFTVLDFDHVIVDGRFTEFGQAIADRFKDTYIEISPSGEGLRVVAIGNVNTDRKRGNGVEMYAAGKAEQFLRLTGAVLTCTVGEVRECQDGIDWAVSVLTQAKTTSPPTKATTTTRNADQVLDALAAYRGDWSKTPEEAEAALTLSAKRSPGKGLAKALALLAAGDDKSEDDLFVMCEAYRRGMDAYEDAADLLDMLATRAKVRDRLDYRLRTAESAARAVLTEIESNAFNRLNYRGWQHLPEQVKDNTPRALPDGVAETLAETGDTLIYGRNGRIEATPGNVKTILITDPKTRGLIAFNESSQNIERTGPWTVFDRHATTRQGVLQDSDIDFVTAWLHRVYGLNMRKAEVMQGLDMASRARSYDPVGDSMHRLGRAWDGQPRAATWLQDFAMVDDTGCSAYVSAAGLCFLVGTVARALDPGCKFDTVLTLEGAGGGGKSTLFQVLSDAVGPDLFTDGIHDVTNPQHRTEVTEGKLIVEIAELAGFRRAADQESLKTVLSQTRDKVRKPYALRPVEILRRYVFAATTNNDQYLADPTGAMARRFLPVKTKATESNPINREALAAVAPQLWGEAVRMYEQGYAPFIAPGSAAWNQWNAQRGARQETLPYEDEVNVLMMNINANNSTGYDLHHGITRKAAAKEIGLDDHAQADQRTMDRLTSTMKAKGFERQPKFAGTYPWKMTPAAFAAAAKMTRERAEMA